MSDMPKRQTSLLRKRRVSLAGARYFLTCSCVRAASRLVDDMVAKAIQSTWLRLESDNDGIVQAATIMPDHIHLIFSLSGRLSIGRVVGKLKSLSKSALVSQNLRWQENFFEHRLRPEEQSNPYALYIFLNPYRARLIKRRDVWPYWRRHPEFDCDFMHLLEDRLYPRKEWLMSTVDGLGLNPEFLGDCEAS